MAQSTSSKKSNTDTYDDLTVISGIGEARQQWLREALAVRTYADLAALSVQDVADQLKQDSKIAATGEIEKWITQAGRLAQQAGGQAKWEVLATFVVAFEEDGKGNYRTRVHHMEADQTEEWVGNEPGRVGDWIDIRLGSKFQKEQEYAAPIVPAVPAAELPTQTEDMTKEDRLKELVAKAAVARDQQRPVPTQSKPAPTAPANMPSPRVFQQPEAQPPAEQPSLYSEKLQRYLTKVRELESSVKLEKL